ncbi:MAG: pyruvate carboxylase subunit [Deltaproteobacteria bacterium]|nr:pyruvate carboxylase subunit [Deltaproteobacteria bacterium]
MSEDILGRLAEDMNKLLTEPAGSRRVQITDLTPRDGQQCKLATRVTTDDLLPLCASIDNCGFYAVEVWGGATFDVCMRYLNEDPWDAEDQVADAAPRPTYSRVPALHR